MRAAVRGMTLEPVAPPAPSVPLPAPVPLVSPYARLGAVRVSAEALTADDPAAALAARSKATATGKTAPD